MPEIVGSNPTRAMPRRWCVNEVQVRTIIRETLALYESSEGIEVEPKLSTLSKDHHCEAKLQTYSMRS